MVLLLVAQVTVIVIERVVGDTFVVAFSTLSSCCVQCGECVSLSCVCVCVCLWFPSDVPRASNPLEGGHAWCLCRRIHWRHLFPATKQFKYGFRKLVSPSGDFDHNYLLLALPSVRIP